MAYTQKQIERSVMKLAWISANANYPDDRLTNEMKHQRLMAVLIQALRVVDKCGMRKVYNDQMKFLSRQYKAYTTKE